MKILINVITNTEIAEIQETYPNFSGTFTITNDTTTVDFIPGEWRAVPDTFVIPDNRKRWIRDVRWIIKYLVKKFLKEQNMHQFAQGVIEMATTYGWPSADRTVADAVLALAPDTTEFTGDGTTRKYVYDFHVDSIDHLRVSVDGVVKTATIHFLYDLDLNGIQFRIAYTPPDGADIVIERV